MFKNVQISFDGVFAICSGSLYKSPVLYLKEGL